MTLGYRWIRDINTIPESDYSPGEDHPFYGQRVFDVKVVCKEGGVLTIDKCPQKEYDGLVKEFRQLVGDETRSEGNVTLVNVKGMQFTFNLLDIFSVEQIFEYPDLAGMWQ